MPTRVIGGSGADARAIRCSEAGAICGDAISTGAFCKRRSGKISRAAATGRPLTKTERGTAVVNNRLAKSSLKISKGGSPSACIASEVTS